MGTSKMGSDGDEASARRRLTDRPQPGRCQLSWVVPPGEATKDERNASMAVDSTFRQVLSSAIDAAMAHLVQLDERRRRRPVGGEDAAACSTDRRRR